jgi:hypothetical protein
MELTLTFESILCETLLQRFVAIPALKVFDQLSPELPSIE